MNSKTKDFQLDIRLGLAVIVLVLLILNFASQYTLFRVKLSIERQLIDEISEAAFVTSNKMIATNNPSLPDSIVSEITYKYSIDSITVIPLNYDRSIAIQFDSTLDTDILQIDQTLTAADLKPILTDEQVYRHERGHDENMIISSFELSGSKYLVAVKKSSPLLASIENAGKILVYSALLGIIVILYVSRKYTRLIISPFKRLKEKAEKSGRLEKQGDDEIAQLVSSYEKIIDELKFKEKELIRLNKIITQRADHLEMHNENILRSINTGIITLDTNCKISSINRSASKILGIDLKNDFIGDNYKKIFKKFAELNLQFEDFISTKAAIYNRSISIDCNNQTKILSVSLSNLIDKNDHAIGYSIILNDQTDFANLQEELELKKRMAVLGEMSGGLAHQLRNSLGGIVGFARLAEKKVNDEIVGKNIRHLLKETSEAEILVSRFLDYARPLELEPSCMDIIKLLKDAAESARKKYTGVDIDLISDEVNISATGDSLLLKQAVGNILSNACKSVETKTGKVVIDFEILKHHLLIKIKDNGPGIPKDYYDKIFAPFFSGSPSGTGLGLPLARKIIMLHEGRLDFISDDSGTTFTISLPLFEVDKKIGKISDKTPINS